MPNRFPFNTPNHPEDNRSINKAFDRNYGNRLKSGDTTTLKYTIKDGDGEPLDKERFPNMQTSLILKYEGVTAYKTEFEATLEEVTENYVGDLVARFRIDEALPPSDTPYVVEFHFEDDEDLFIFPSVNTLELYITPSALNSDEEAIKSISDQRLNEIIERKLEENPVLSEAEANELARQENYQELLDTGVMQTKINERLEDLEEEYAPKLTEVTAQLAHTAKEFESFEFANAVDDLNLINYLGNNQNIHPKVLDFEGGWNGFKYWMAYTPYPNGETRHENPCIAVSNDLVNWTIPEGLINPLDIPDDISSSYNSDTHLVYREDKDELEIWWRLFNHVNSKFTIFRSKSKDGVSWTPKEAVFYEEDIRDNDMLSPSVLFEDNKYKIYFVSNGSKKYVRYIESLDSEGLAWTSKTDIPIKWGDLTPWHMDVIRTEKGLEFVVNAYGIEKGSSNGANIYYVLMKNDGSLTLPRLILKTSSNPTGIDNQSTYRGSLLKINDMYHLFYSSISNDGKRHMSLASGTNIFSLKGYVDYSRVNHKVGDRTVTVSGNITLEDFDVSNIDTIKVRAGGYITVKSIKGGYDGKRITFIMVTGSNQTGVRFVPGSRLILPNGEEYTLKYTVGMAVDVICTDAETQQWRVVVKPQSPKVVTINGGTTLTDYDVSEIDTLIFRGNSPVVVNSFKGGVIGQKLHVVLLGSVASGEFICDSVRLVLPGLENYTLTMTQVGMTFICTAPDEWRGFT